MWSVLDWTSANADYPAVSVYIPYMGTSVGYDVCIAEPAGKYWA